MGGNCQIWLQTQGDLVMQYCVIVHSRVNLPCSSWGHCGVLFRNIIWWTKSWGELSCHHVNYACWIWPCFVFFVLFFFVFFKINPHHLNQIASSNYSSVSRSISPVRQWKWFLFNNSTVLITFHFVDNPFCMKCFVFLQKNCSHSLLVKTVSMSLCCLFLIGFYGVSLFHPVRSWFLIFFFLTPQNIEMLNWRIIELYTEQWIYCWNVEFLCHNKHEVSLGDVFLKWCHVKDTRCSAGDYAIP